MRLVLICFSINPSNLSASFRAIKLVKYFLRSGVSVEILSSDLALNIPDEFADIHHSVPYTPYFKSYNNIIGRLVRRTLIYPEPEFIWVKSVVKEFLNIYSNNLPDAIIISSPPHSIQIAGVKLNQITGVQYIADLRDDWITNHSLRFYTPAHKYFAKTYEKQIAETANHIILNTTIVRKRFEQRYQSYINKFITVTNGYDEDDFLNGQCDNIIKFKNKNIIAYTGSGYGDYIVNTIISLCNDLRKEGISHKWHIVTAGPRIVEKPGYVDVWSHLGILSHQEVASLLINSKILLLPMFPGEKENSGTVLLKTYSYLRSKKAIVYFGEDGATPNLLKQFEGTFCFPRNTFADFVNWLKNNQNNIKTQYCRDNISEYSLEVLANKILELACQNI